MRRARWGWMVAGLVVVGGGCVALYQLRYRTDHTTTPVDVGEAIAEFQDSTVPPTSTAAGASSSTTASPQSSGTEAATTISTPAPTATTPSAPLLPKPGVYVYATTGGDEIDALGGASHSYPATTTITVTAWGCGVSEKWVAAEERSDEWAVCSAEEGLAQGGFTAFRRFFGVDTIEPYTCTGEPRPLSAASGTTWTSHCTLNGGQTTWTGEVLGPDTVEVGGTAVDAVHVVVTIDNGDSRDAQRTETWYQAGTDVVLRRVVHNATTTDSPIGDVHYVEDYEIVLTSLTPAS